MVSPDIHTETLLANASEDLLSISAIAADLATREKYRDQHRLTVGASLLAMSALQLFPQLKPDAVVARGFIPAGLRSSPKWLNVGNLTLRGDWF
ncbi:hypothetical protein SAMN03159382_05888 [Pseudomonas sp. NFACC23-1]|nr:hypothetical protein SAMN03159386_05903 [Pseudomonas sp. NFACC17-2]SEJ98733.1 hypothetical protein SAMN03159382_05888 [Pseudomonas sp. NFACC23-1]SFW87328.1 hypothetical protein SAMN05660640_04655 [Pseudomonas sp. NFACC16-2]